MTQTHIPRHIAVIMDGNGRWAKQRRLPRVAGHKAGFESVRAIVKNCAERRIESLTLFAFSTENWQRPENEVDFLMNLFVIALQREVKKIHKQNIKFRLIGDRYRFNKKLQEHINAAEVLTANNTGMNLIIAANYGGHWDLVTGIKKIAADIEQGTLTSQQISAELIRKHLTLADLPEPDLLIRTSGEQRISNFMLWQLAYTELYFTNTLWPDFNADELEKALHYFANRERRFGYISEQIKTEQHA